MSSRRFPESNSASLMALPASSSSPIGVAIAGLGFGESVHLLSLAAQSDLEAVALWHPRSERLDQACVEQDRKSVV